MYKPEFFGNLKVPYCSECGHMMEWVELFYSARWHCEHCAVEEMGKRKEPDADAWIELDLDEDATKPGKGPAKKATQVKVCRHRNTSWTHYAPWGDVESCIDCGKIIQGIPGASLVP